MAVVRTALQTAQHWLDRGKATRWDVVAAHVALHVQEAVSLIGQSGAWRQLAGQLDETCRALDLYIVTVGSTLQGSELDKFGHEFRPLRATTNNMRRVLGLSEQPKKTQHKRASQRDDVYEAQALDAVLDLIAHEAGQAFRQAHDSRDPRRYQAIILSTIPSLQRRLSYAVSVMGAYAGSDKHSRFARGIQPAAKALAELQRFINGRQNNKEMLTQFALVEGSANQLLAAVQLSPLSSIKVETSNAQDDSKEEEKLAVTTARNRLDRVLHDLQTKINLGAQNFFDYSQLVDPPKPGSMWPELVKGLLISLITNVIGTGAGNLINRFAAQAAALTGKFGHVSDRSKKTVNGDTSKGSAVDTLQAWTGSVDDAMNEAASDKNEQTRDAILFRQAVILAAARTHKLLMGTVDTRIEKKEIAADEITNETGRIELEAKDAAERTLQLSAKGFATLMAQRTLGAIDAPDKPPSKDDKDQQPPLRKLKPDEKPKLTKIPGAHDYFFGSEAIAKGGKRDDVKGIARIKVDLSSTGFEAKELQLVGLNSDIAKSVVAGSERLGKLEVPAEIEVTLKGRSGNWFLLVDESGTLHSYTSWESFRASIPADEALVEPFRTPQQTWAKLQTLSLRNVTVTGG